jgi:tetratricopeptide (TPR) repeat protein
MRIVRLALHNALLLCAALPAIATPEMQAVAQQHWFAVRTAHFSIFSCGPAQEVTRLGDKLEQFHDAYFLLAGAQAASSPPIIVLAFPDHRELDPFLPLYQGKPANMEAFFRHGDEENVIVLSMADLKTRSMHVIFHEYSHLLFRNNEKVWPLWLAEGMAEIYGTFEVVGFEVRVGKPIESHLRFLRREQWMPLKELFSVGHDSPQYNESERQGAFYAEAWLLTHYLMLGPNADRKARFGQLTALLRQGQNPEQAFTNAFRCTPASMEAELRRYLERDHFDFLPYHLPYDLSKPHGFTARVIAPVEVWFRLGDELMRIGRLDAAESCFTEARKLAPKSPLPYEGFGLLAAARQKHPDAVRELQESLSLGSGSYLAHYVYAEEKYELTADDRGRHSRLGKEAAAEIRAELEKSIALMPFFAPSHGLLGFFDLVQGEELPQAEQHLQKAVQLDPANYWYQLQLGQAQYLAHDTEAARRTLQSLSLPYVDSKLRKSAEDILNAINQPASSQRK